MYDHQIVEVKLYWSFQFRKTTCAVAFLAHGTVGKCISVA
jgi:hypothetical protein